MRVLHTLFHGVTVFVCVRVSVCTCERECVYLGCVSLVCSFTVRDPHCSLPCSWSQQAREFSHQQSQLVNDAYRTLRTPNLRAQYLLRMCGVPEIENGASGASVPMEFLEEMLDRCDETLRSEDVERLRQLRQECDSMTEQACQEAQRALDKKDMEVTNIHTHTIF